MDMLNRKHMSSVEAILKIIIGLFFVTFIVGVFLIIVGIKERKRIIQNNFLNPIAIRIHNNGVVEVLDFYGNKHAIFLKNIKCIRMSNSNKIHYLIYFDNDNEKSICLGYIENNEARNFNNLLNT